MTTINLSHGRGLEKTSFIDKALLASRFLQSGMTARNDIILFTDAYDVAILDHMDTIAAKFLSFGKKVVFGGEKVFWPLLENMPTVFDLDRAPIRDAMSDGEETGYRFINSGVYIGYAHAIEKLLSFCVTEHARTTARSDQAALQAAWMHLRNDDENFAAIDRMATIFANSSNDRAAFMTDGLSVSEPCTGQTPSVLHANGNKDIIDGIDLILTLRQHGAWHIRLRSLVTESGLRLALDNGRLVDEIPEKSVVILATTADNANVLLTADGSICTFNPDGWISTSARHVSGWEQVFLTDDQQPYVNLNGDAVGFEQFCKQATGPVHLAPLRLSDLRLSGDALAARLLSLS
ncbi:hypothetical protein AA103196_0154 [Ameyamaea chiangmaiensis NBRC 103196]|nr:hypothetical protein AA103196_0154 [Ameyamaea chiangmaiensis NBRC 103196]